MEDVCRELAGTGINSYLMVTLAVVLILSSYLAFRYKIKGAFVVTMFIFTTLTASLLPIAQLSAQSADDCQDSPASTPTDPDNAAAALNDGPFYIGTGVNNIIAVSVLNNDSPGSSSFDLATLDLDPSTPSIDSDFTYSGGDFTHYTNDGIVLFSPYAPLTVGETISIPYTIKTLDGKTAGPANIIIEVVEWIAQGDIIEFCGSNDENSASILLNDFHASGINAATIDLDPQTPGQQTTVVSSDGQVTFTLSGSQVYANLPAGGFSTPGNLMGGPYIIYYTVEANDGTLSNPAPIRPVYASFDCGQT